MMNLVTGRKVFELDGRLMLAPLVQRDKGVKPFRFYENSVTCKPVLLAGGHTKHSARGMLALPGKGWVVFLAGR